MDGQAIADSVLSGRPIGAKAGISGDQIAAEVLRGKASAPVASAPTGPAAEQAAALGYQPVGKFNDGIIYSGPNGDRLFISPSYTTSDPQAIDNMMADRRPHRDEIGMVEGLLRAGSQGHSLYVGDEASSGTAAAIDKATGQTPGTFRPPVADPNNPNGPPVADTRPPTMGERNSMYLSRERDKIDNFAEENPKSALAAELVGSLLPGFGMAGLGEKLIKGGSRAKRAIGAGLEGSIFGTAAAFNAGEGGYESRTVDGITGGTLGLFAGAGGSVLFNAAGAGWDKLRRSLAARVGTAEGRAEAQMARAMADAGMSPEDITARLAELGPEGVVLDALGEPGRGLARSAANNSGVARENLKEMSATRMAGQPDRMTDALLDASGLDEPRTLDELVNASRDEARPGITAAYKEASAAGNDIDLDLFSDITQTRIGKEAFEEGMAAAKDRMRGKGEPSPLDVLDEAKKYLDGYAQPTPGMRPTPKQQFAAELASDIRTRTDQLLDEYEGARGLAQSQFKREEAFGLGAEGAKPRIASDFGRRVAADEGANADAIAKGYAAAKIDQIQNRRTTAGAVDALFGPPPSTGRAGYRAWSQGRPGQEPDRHRKDVQHGGSRHQRQLHHGTTACRKRPCRRRRHRRGSLSWRGRGISGPRLARVPVAQEKRWRGGQGLRGQGEQGCSGNRGGIPHVARHGVARSSRGCG